MLTCPSHMQLLFDFPFLFLQLRTIYNKCLCNEHQPECVCVCVCVCIYWFACNEQGFLVQDLCIIWLKWDSNAIQFIHKYIFLWKNVSFCWIDFTNVLSILQKLKVTNNSIAILGYSNDKNVYIVKNIILIE